MKKEIRLIINKSEISAGTRGASLGPEAIMAAARSAGKSFFSRFKIDHVADQNHLLDNEVKYHNSRRIEGLIAVYKSVIEVVNKTINNNEFPLILAADHGSAGGTIAGLKAAYPNERLGVVWIDAHSDIHSPYTTPTGNMHGMPLSVALSEDNLEELKNDLSTTEIDLWNQLKLLGHEGRKLAPDNIVFVGVRDLEVQEAELMKRLKLKNHDVDSIRAKGVEIVLKEILQQLSNCDRIYVSFDVDSMDPILTSRGTGTPVDNGLTPDEAVILLTGLAKEPKIVCVEFVEVNPLLDDKKNRMAEITFDLVEKTTKALQNS